MGSMCIVPGSHSSHAALHFAGLANTWQRSLAGAAGKGGGSRRGAFYSSSWDGALCAKSERQSRAIGRTRPCSVSAAQKLLSRST